MTRNTFQQLAPDYERLLTTVKVRSTWKNGIEASARQIIEHKDRYLEVQDKTGVPWYFVGVIHSLESGRNFSAHLHNGDPLTSRTRLVPRGRPLKGSPPFTWLESAIDALTMKDLHKIKVWTVTRMAYELERYNGFGYRNNHPDVLSPYLWSGTNHYTKGKYVADGKFSATAVSKQIGAIPLLLKVMELDKSPVKSVVETVKDSKSLTTLGYSWMMIVFGYFADAFSGLFNTILWVLSLIPVVGEELTSFLGGAEKISTSLNIPWASISVGLAAACIAMVFLRQLPNKQRGK